MKKILLSTFLFTALFSNAQADSTAFESFQGSQNEIKRYISIPTPSNSSLKLDTSWTIEAWIYIPNSSQNQQMFIVESYSGSNTGGFVLRISNSKIQAYQIAGPSSSVQVLGATNVSYGTWNHVAASLNESTHKLEVYLNGVLDGSSTCNLATSYSNTYTYIGARGDDQQVWQPLKIDEVRIWNQAKSANEILDLMNSCLNGNEDGLVAYYSFEGQTTENVIDKSVNNNNGIIENFASQSLIKGAFSCQTNGVNGTDELSLNTMTIYPNPVKSTLTINSSEQINSVFIFDLLGTFVKKEKNSTIIVEELKPGVYFIHINTAKGIQQLKFIKE